jgi:hypothetical protein
MKRMALVAVLVLTGCDDPATARRAVEAMGMSEVQTHGWAVFGCSEDDMFVTRFSATNPKGARVTGVVCSGWLKGSTVRID